MNEKRLKELEESTNKKFDVLLARAMSEDFSTNPYIKQMNLTALIFDAMEIGRDSVFEAMN
jgi:hypothetical protein